MDQLQPGETAYVRAGAYAESSRGSCSNTFNRLFWMTPGSSGAPITISGYQGEEKQVIVKTAINLYGNFQILENMVVDRNRALSPFDHACDGQPNVQVYAADDIVRGLEVRGSAMSGIYLEGADRAQLERNWIHDNGEHWNLDHGVYYHSGLHGVVGNNIVNGNYANGIKIGPAPQGTLVTENTVVGNGRSGVIVSGGGQSAFSNNTVVANNILANNGIGDGGGYGLRTYWDRPVSVPETRRTRI